MIHSNKQRTLAIEVTLTALTDEDCLLPTDCCEGGRVSLKLGKMVLWASANTLLSNYYSKENNMLAKNRETGKMEQESLSQSLNAYFIQVCKLFLQCG